jgi:hypothetical protein
MMVSPSQLLPNRLLLPAEQRGSPKAGRLTYARA